MLKAAVLFLALAAQAPTSTIVKRVYAADEAATYGFTMKVADMDGTGVLKYKVTKLGEKGEATLETSLSELVGVPFGQTPPQTNRFDDHGMMLGAQVKDERAMHALFALASFSPGVDMKIGDPTKVNWHDDAFLIDGSFTLKELKEEKGVKLAVVHSAYTATPTSDTPAKVKMDQTLEVATGKMVKADVDLIINDAPVKITFKRKDS